MIGLHAQDSPTVPEPYNGGLKVKLNDSGSKYFRLITWHQFQLLASDEFDENFDVSAQLRRSRMLMFAQLSDRFLVLTHFGLNNLTSAGLHPTGQSSQAQLFMHDAWVEYKLANNVYMGGGLHYWNGISRLNNQSTLNMMPLDNPRFAWATIGTSDQFARHIGLYVKGTVKNKLNYRFAWNQPMTNSIDLGDELTPDAASYQGAFYEGHKDAGHAFSGYVNYEVFDSESTKLPYFVGTYLGAKKVLSVGGGFFYHPKGSVSLNSESTEIISHDVLLFSADVFYDAPLGDNGSAISAYAGYFNYDFGPNYALGGTSVDINTSNTIYTQIGYLLPKFSEKMRVQPYVTASTRDADAFGDNLIQDVNLGANFFINGHNAKYTIQYGYRQVGTAPTDGITVQAHIFL
ncbi:hypothetical protein [Sanyastnella coralliicola]|uniref:hypothetical protein n=1 Tax=Sanyastnella coralliicola TaxID=3069118 RepID=UPI0027BAB818|nr:hypothetical protein [Longitalea sp. SCSIO 12813]